MFNYFRFAIRHLWKNKLFSIINIIGLSLGLAACFVILLHVRFETGYDRFHKNRDRIFRITQLEYTFTPLVMSGLLQAYFPEIEKTVRFGKFDWGNFYVIRNREFILEKDLAFADPTFFDVFSFPVKTGNPEKMLRSPDKIMLSEKMANKYFHDENPIGKNFQLRLMNMTISFIVEGVYYDFPEQSHIHANFLVSEKYFEKIEGERVLTSWGSNSVMTYILLKQPETMKSVEDRFPGFLKKYAPADILNDLQFYIQPLLRIHLYSDKMKMDIEPQSSITRVTLFTSIAILVLIIAVVNFLLLSMAISYQRTREFGIRSIVGALRKDLVSLVSAEFLIVFLFAVQIALMLVELFIPLLESRMNFHVYHGVFANAPLLILFMLAVFFMGYLASLFITLNISRIQPVDALKRMSVGRRSGLASRGILVIFQFCIMISLLVSLMVMHKQQWLLRNIDLGYRKDLLVTLDVPMNELAKYNLLKEEVKKLHGVSVVSGAVYVPPGKQFWMNDVKDPISGKSFQLEEIFGDYDLLESLGIPMVEGRTFSRDYGNDSMAVLLNESAVKLMQLRNPLESYLVRGLTDNSESRRQIIGVFKDFHIRSLYEKVQPMMVLLNFPMIQQMSIRLSGSDPGGTMDAIRKKWSEIYPDDPIQYVFVDEALHLSYLREDQAQAMITMFTMLSVFIALMGLFGLSAFVLEKRTKETGIRKVNGARLIDILFVLTRQFALWILIAFAIAVPASWYAMHRWLQHFAYRTSITWWVFILVLFISIMVAGLTIFWQTIRAANRNPVESLRYE